MTCAYCEKPAHAREMCHMHYRRFRAYGTPLHKRRKRGVMDAPVTYPLGPAQKQIVVTLLQNPGRVFPWYALGNTEAGFVTALRHIRERYGRDVVETVVKPRGYRMNPVVAKKLAAML